MIEVIDTNFEEDENGGEQVLIKDDINIETDYNQTTGPGQEVCKICWKSFESEPKIRCAECSNTVICLQCFSLGLETQQHACGHAYHIDRRHIPIDPDTDWTLSEDFDLLQGLLECGYGNYVDIGKRLMHRTVEEIRIRTDELLGLDKAPLRACLEVVPRPLVKYNAEFVSEEPPRYPPRSLFARQSAGYCAPRGDFATEYSNNAEAMLGELEFGSEDEDDNDVTLTENLSCAIVQCYNEVLKERQRRKQIVKQHALLLRRTPLLLTSVQYSGLLPFIQLLDSDEFTSLVEGLNAEAILRSKFRRLRKYRDLGITRHRGVALYEKLDFMRSSATRDLSKTVKPPPTLKGVICQQRKAPRPLDVTQFSGHENLSPREKELCANIRMLPTHFIRFKEMLVAADVAEGGVSLKTARQMFKIDVNKTRKLFNFLRDEGIIKVITS